MTTRYFSFVDELKGNDIIFGTINDIMDQIFKHKYLVEIFPDFKYAEMINTYDIFMKFKIKDNFTHGNLLSLQDVTTYDIMISADLNLINNIQKLLVFAIMKNNLNLIKYFASKKEFNFHDYELLITKSIRFLILGDCNIDFVDRLFYWMSQQSIKKKILLLIFNQSVNAINHSHDLFPSLKYFSPYMGKNISRDLLKILIINTSKSKISSYNIIALTNLLDYYIKSLPGGNLHLVIMRLAIQNGVLHIISHITMNYQTNNEYSINYILKNIIKFMISTDNYDLDNFMTYLKTNTRRINFETMFIDIIKISNTKNYYNPDTIKKLLDYVLINGKININSQSILDVIGVSSLEIIIFCHINGADIRNRSIIKSAVASMYGSITVPYLIKNGADITSDLPLLITLSITKQDNADVLKMILNNNTDIKTDEFTKHDFMTLALKTDNIEIIKYLLSQKIMMSDTSIPEIINIINRNHKELLSVVMKSGYDVSQHASILLRTAIDKCKDLPRYGSLMLGQLLSCKDININCIVDRENNYCLLEYAIIHCSKFIMKYLLKHGAEIYYPDNRIILSIISTGDTQKLDIILEKYEFDTAEKLYDLCIAKNTNDAKTLLASSKYLIKKN